MEKDRRRGVILLLALVLSLGLARAQDVPGLASEYRQLRTVPGHFSGSAWNDAVDSFQGRKHQVMAELGNLLGDGKHTRSEVIGLLGEPDRVLDPSSPFWPVMNQVGPAREALVYNWRGSHDFLYFPVLEGRVLSSGWWMAYE